MSGKNGLSRFHSDSEYETRGFGVLKNGLCMFFCSWLHNNKNPIDQILRTFIISDLRKAWLISGLSLCFIFHGYRAYKCFTIELARTKSKLGRKMENKMNPTLNFIMQKLY